MNKKADEVMSSLVIRLIGAAIVLVTIFIIFAGLAQPVLSYMADYEAIKSYNRMASSISVSCDQGADTISYVTFPASGRRGYIFAIVNEPFANQVHGLDICGEEESGRTCTTSTSRSRIFDCRTAYHYCFCLIKFETDIDNNCILNEEYDVFIMDRHREAIYGEINDGIEVVLDNLDLTGSNNGILKVEVLQCRGFDGMNCLHGEDNFPVLFGAYGEGTVLWMHTRGKITTHYDDWGVQIGSSYSHSSLELTSLSFQRAMYGGEYDYYSNFYSRPEFDVLNIEKLENNQDIVVCHD